jgi:hypothetical protein
MDETREMHTNRILQWSKPFEIFEHKWESNTKMDLRKEGRKITDLTDAIQDMVQLVSICEHDVNLCFT